MLRRGLLFVLAAASLAGGLVPASVFAAERPSGSRPDAKHLRALGLDVTWPLRTGSQSVAPNTTLRVRVRPRAGRRVTPVLLVFSEVTASGKHRRRLLERRVRRGTFTVVVPAAGGAHYALTLKAGKRTYRSWVRTPSSPTASQDGYVPTPAPGDYRPVAPGPGPPWTCGDPAATTTVAVTLSATTVRPGGWLMYTLRNTGTACLRTGPEGSLEQLVDGQWTPSPVWREPKPLAFGLTPGGALDNGFTIWGDTPPGRYRVTVRADVVADFGTVAPIGVTAASAEFDVLPLP